MSMTTWKAKSFSKRTKGSQTPGKTKGPNCQATSLEKYMAKRSRSYKHPLYEQYCLVKNGDRVSRSIG